MIHLKNINKALLSLLVIVNLFISFEFASSQEFIANDFNIELLIANSQYKNKPIDFVDQLNQTIEVNQPIYNFNKIHDFENQIDTQNSLIHLKIRTRKFVVLNYTSILNKIVLNEISIQKFHCI
jgi:hypothetical protein